MMWKRPAVMAGKFYPAEKNQLRRTIDAFFTSPLGPPRKALGLMAPHAGYLYAGRLAAQVYGKVKIPETVIILSPNHTGRGPKLSIWSEGFWETPLGRIPVDETLSAKLLKDLRLKDGDMLAHATEHGIEVALPFLQYFQPSLKIIPIVLGLQSYQECMRMAKVLKELVDEAPKDSILLVASSDLSHFIPAEEALVKDEILLKLIENLDSQQFYEMVLREKMPICGFVPITIVLKTCQMLGAQSGERVSYATSADVTGDFTSVVSYANAFFY